MKYYYTVDDTSPADWDQTLSLFRDATIYQTFSYGKIRWGEDRLSHVKLFKEKTICAACQVRIIPLSHLRTGIAYVTWGPLWLPWRVEPDREDFKQILAVLKEEYVVKRKLFLKVRSKEMESPENEWMRSAFLSLGYRFNPSDYQTKYVDLSAGTQGLQQGLSKNWKEALKKAHKAELTVESGTDQRLFDIFLELYREMHQRKGFVEGVKVEEYGDIQADLPPDFKMEIIACFAGSEPVAVNMGSMLGEMGIVIIGATGNLGLKKGAQHLCIIRLLEWMQEKGGRYFDFGGYDPEANPGTAFFKRGIPGDVVVHLGNFDCWAGTLSKTVGYAAEFYRKRAPFLQMVMKRFEGLGRHREKSRGGTR